MARSSRSTSTASPISACSSNGSGGATAPPARARVVYEAFDLMYLDGTSLIDLPLEDRKARLERSSATTRGSG